MKCQNNYQLLFWRTRRVTSLGPFFKSIAIMMDVAKARPYLQTMSTNPQTRNAEYATGLTK